MSQNERFLLIKAWGYGFWSDMDDVQSKLLLAEITDRQPIVYWGGNSLYSVGNCNSFEQFFLPCSNLLIKDIISDKFTYYPHIWNASNILNEDRTKLKRQFRDIPSFIYSNANVLVSDVHNYIFEFIPWLKKEHSAYEYCRVFRPYCQNSILSISRNTVNDMQRKAEDLHRYIIKKYIKLRPEISDEIDQFYNIHMKNSPVVAVHVRSDDKRSEVRDLNKINEQYHSEIQNYLKDNPSARIFLLTSNCMVFEQYKELYGDILIYTDCTRNDFSIHRSVFPERKRKGIEIIKDTYLAARCDYFIGIENSNVSLAISRLKVWDNNSIKLLK
jgi:hypothetical protein